MNEATAPISQHGQRARSGRVDGRHGFRSGRVGRRGVSPRRLRDSAWRALRRGGSDSWCVARSAYGCRSGRCPRCRRRAGGQARSLRRCGRVAPAGDRLQARHLLRPARIHRVEAALSCQMRRVRRYVRQRTACRTTRGVTCTEKEGPRPDTNRSRHRPARRRSNRRAAMQP